MRYGGVAYFSEAKLHILIIVGKLTRAPRCRAVPVLRRWLRFGIYMIGIFVLVRQVSAGKVRSELKGTFYRRLKSTMYASAGPPDE